ncbi:nucleobase-ascorbate transporter 3-like [Spinacia oleracea]|uniref:Nucleobase-ascorbate transporter 3-like n=1 Tax=Spinacia oleracea TaxID=3562 RepID=A0ABM3RG34_SPIOL|nr:nucleobase-ascorbate transporter 3-like [Spinacia oleracea]
MLGTTILITNSVVPLMGGNRGDKACVIQGMLFMSGINTLIQTLIGSRLPVVMGPSYVYLIPIMSIISSNNTGNYDSEHQRFFHNIRTIQGYLIVSFFVSIILVFNKAWGNFTKAL